MRVLGKSGCKYRVILQYFLTEEDFEYLGWIPLAKYIVQRQCQQQDLKECNIRI
jgi:hypothetical protein